MLNSMTGYGKGEARQDDITVTVEIKTVNHRYADITVKLPRTFLSHENGVRKQVGAVPLSVFIEQLQTRPEFPQVGALTCLILGRKVTKADPLPGMEEEPKKRRRKTPQQPRNRNHDPNAIFPCEVCDKTFTRNDCLRRHNLMFHEENKPYTCDVCHKSFARPDLLNRHKKGHTRENESYACALCGSKFTR